MGINPAVAEKIYDAFEQGDVGVAREFGGTGLGLSVSQRLARLMGGDIAFRPGAEAGTIFTLQVPVYHGSANVLLEADESAHDAVDLKPGLRVLVVEDDKTTQIVYFEILSQAGADVDIVDNGRQCLERLKVQDYDIILMDYKMPEMDGITATRHIRTGAYRQGGIPIVAISAEVFKGEENQWLQAGANHFIMKPLSAGALKAAIQLTLSQPVNGAAHADTS